MISQRYIVVMCVPVICLVLGTLTGAAQGGSDAAPVRRISHVLTGAACDSLVAHMFNGLQPSKMAAHYAPQRRLEKTRVFQQPACSYSLTAIPAFSMMPAVVELHEGALCPWRRLNRESVRRDEIA